MLIFAGLGNPGPKYARHRHNIGYMVADEIIRRYDFRLAQARHHSYVATGDIRGEKILLLKPKTFMNGSGRAVGSALRYYKLKARYVTATGGETLMLNMPAYFAIVEKREAPASRNEPRRDVIREIQIAGPETAFARVNCAIGERHFTDLLSLIRVDGEWRIIAKVFHYDLI